MNFKKGIKLLIIIGLLILLNNCSKSKDQRKTIPTPLLYNLIVQAFGPGCNRIFYSCVYSLIRDKNWYMVGSNEQPRNLFGHTETYVNTNYCHNKTKINILGYPSISITAEYVSGTTPGCNKDMPSGSYTTFADMMSNSFYFYPFSTECFDVTIRQGNVNSLVGRGWVDRNGTQLKLELYKYNDSSTSSGYSCYYGPVGSKIGLQPDSTSCNSSDYVCNPSSDSSYNNVQVYDLTE